MPLSPRTTYTLTAFVWTCAILTVAILRAYLPLVQGALWWVWGTGEPPR